MNPDLYKINIMICGQQGMVYNEYLNDLTDQGELLTGYSKEKAESICDALEDMFNEKKAMTLINYDEETHLRNSFSCRTENLFLFTYLEQV